MKKEEKMEIKIKKTKKDFYFLNLEKYLIRKNKTKKLQLKEKKIKN